MPALVPTIGLEIHAELKTKTKMFCRSKNDPDEKQPNVNVCPICLAHPGALPTINKKAVEHVLRVGLALGGALADYSEFDRKNYFYPDIPKGYQISQYQFPLVRGGELLGVKLTRVHLEEDTATSIHQADCSLLDFNRAGVPLLELVTEPVITSARQAGDFARELQLTLRYLGVSEANMEKGEMRVEANISIGKVALEPTASALGTKVEIKNLNSFRAVERAIDYELRRQQEVIESGERVTQETRGWDEGKQTTFSQRQKESSHDYRYFPDPDLPKLKISEIPEFSIENLTKTIPELPSQKRTRYRREYEIKDEDIEVFVTDIALDQFFEGAVKDLKEDKKLVRLAANYITSDIIGQRKANSALPLPGHGHFADLIKMVGAGEISSRGAKDILAAMLRRDADPRAVAAEKNLFQKSDEGHLQEIVAAVIATNPKVVADYQSGKPAAIQFLVGQGMKESRGAANPEVLRKLLLERLSPAA